MLLVITIVLEVFASGYFIDYESGDDSGTGTSTTDAWKHSPGDAGATGVPAAYIPVPGDTLYFRGGICYRGAITVKSDGTVDAPIVYKGNGWGEEKAIVDGSERITSQWFPCGNANEAMGNPDWEKIWYSDVPTLQTNAFAANLHENDSFVYVAQYPSPTDPFFPDNTGEYLQNTTITSTSLVDDRLTDLGGHLLVGGYVLLWEANNTVRTHHITALDNESGRLTYTESSSTNYYDRFALANCVTLIDAPGEYVFDESLQNDSVHRMYLWPHNSDPNGEEITISQRRIAFELTRRKSVVVEGFIIRRFAGSSDQGGRTVPIFSASQPEERYATNITVKNNVIRHNRYNEYADYAILILSSIHCTVENNLVEENPFERGIGVVGGRGGVIRNNTIRKPGGTAIDLSAMEEGFILDNTVEDGHGVHANGISLYQNSNSCVIARNIVVNSKFALTVQSSGNLLVYNNFFDGSNAINYLIASWGEMFGTSIIAGNTLINSENHAALSLGDTVEQRDFICVNNVIDGAGGSTTVRRNNLYIGVSWNMEPRYGWKPGEGEVIDTDESGDYKSIPALEVFADDSSGYLCRKSRCIGKGLNVKNYFDSLCGTDTNLTRLRNLTSDFSWRTTLSGVSRPMEGNWDIGAFQFDTTSHSIEKPLNYVKENGHQSIGITGDILTIPTRSGTEYEVSMFTLKGSCIYQKLVSSGRIDLSKRCCAQGVYFIHVHPLDKRDYRPVVLRYHSISGAGSSSR